MTMDEIVLKFKSDFGKMKSELSDVISKFQKLDDETSKSGNSFDELSNPLDKLQNKLKSLQNEYDNLNRKLKKTTLSVDKDSLSFTDNSVADLETVYSNLEKEYSDLMSEISRKSKELDNIADDVEYNNAVESLNELGKKQQEILHNSRILKDAIYFKKQFDGMSYDDVINSLKNYETEIDSTRVKIDNLSKSAPKFVPNTEEASRKLENIGNNADNASSKMNSLGRRVSVVNNSFSKLGVGLKAISKLFDKFSKSFSKGFDNKFRELKKLALGLIGVRTAMSVLTKSVNAYLSFDSELQDSLTNSWNMLGSLLAPAIELVAQMFALATNYIAQFVNALTGIDLVARANAKALETQAKATRKANNAQRGLLSMDEITNLPTESAISPANQIKQDYIKPGEMFNGLVDAFKNNEWHRIGEIIAEGIDSAMYSLNWNKIRKTAYDIGYYTADLLNGVFELDWGKLGETIGNGINTAFDIARGFLDKFSFIQFAKGLATTVTKTFKTIEWGDIAQTLSDALINVLDSIRIFFETVDWVTVGESIKTFILNIKWLDIGVAIAKAIMSGMNVFNDLIRGLFGDTVADIIQDVSKFFNPFKLLMSVVTGDLFNFSDTTKNIFRTIGDVIYTIINFVKNVIVGFAKGVANLFVSVGKGIVNSIILPFNIFIDALNGVLLPLKGIVAAFNKITGKNVSLENLRIPKIPALETGTNYVETEGIYHLHEGEEVVPKRYNPSADGYNNNTDNKQIIDLLVSLNASMLEYADRPISIDINGRKFAEATYNDFKQVDRNKNTSSVVVRS